LPYESQHFHHYRNAKLVHELAFSKRSALSTLVTRSDMDTTVKKLKKARIPFDVHIQHYPPFIDVIDVYVAKEDAKRAKRKLLELF